MTTTTTTTTSPFLPDLAMYIWGEAGGANAIGRPRVWADIWAENEFTPETYFRRSDDGVGTYQIALSVRGTFVATVTLQRSFDGGSTWQDVESYTEPIEKSIVNTDQSLLWRLGVKSGDYTSGNVVCVLLQ